MGLAGASSCVLAAPERASALQQPLRADHSFRRALKPEVIRAPFALAPGLREEPPVSVRALRDAAYDDDNVDEEGPASGGESKLRVPASHCAQHDEAAWMMRAPRRRKTHTTITAGETFVQYIRVRAIWKEIELSKLRVLAEDSTWWNGASAAFAVACMSRASRTFFASRSDADRK